MVYHALRMNVFQEKPLNSVACIEENNLKVNVVNNDIRIHHIWDWKTLTADRFSWRRLKAHMGF